MPLSCPPKVWYKSRTLIVQAIGITVTLISGASELDYVKAHLKEFAYASFVLNTILRLFTTQGVSAVQHDEPITVPDVKS